jgi:hypothetical protein
MKRHTVTLMPNDQNIEGFFVEDIGAAALKAMNTIPGVCNPEIVSESTTKVTVSYGWEGQDVFWQAGEYLAKFGMAISTDDD